MSIIPGIETRAPERTETRSGLSGSPKLLPVSASTFFSAARSSASSARGSFMPARVYSAQTSVVIVKPGGTGIPMFDISARPAPFPPSSSFISLLPSALPPPKA